MLADPRNQSLLAAEIVLAVFPGHGFVVVAGEPILRQVLQSGTGAESRIGVIKVGSEFEAFELRRHFDSMRADTASVPSVASGS